MLAELSVRNLALIEELDLVFGPGFNVLTGETGAGKSIIVGAINLILGSRASADLVRLGAEETEVQALFHFDDPAGLDRRLEELGLPKAEGLIIRRVLHKSGRNRLYINGALAALSQLASLARDLVAVSGQHEHQQLLQADRQLLFLDQFAGLMPRRAAMSQVYNALVDLTDKAGRLENRINEAKARIDLWHFQAREIEAAALTPGEDEVLEKERSLSRNAEKIFSLVKEGYDHLYGRSGAVIESLDGARTAVRRAAAMDDRLAPVWSRIEESYHELADVALVLRDHLDRIRFDPERLEEIEARLALLGRLKKKYGPTLDEVMAYARKISSDLDQVEEMERDWDGLKAAVDEARRQVRETAGRLSVLRREAGGRMAAVLASELRTLGLPHLEFAIEFRNSGGTDGSEVALGPLGWDEIEFLISPNLGEQPRPLARIASGGELSRTTLALKSLLAGQDRVQTLIFDEVDAGIGGAVAEVVGRKLRSLSRFHQLLCITHLPQIAVFGQNHHYVYKEVRGERTLTVIRSLDEEERREEIARMMSGEAPTAKTRAAARELLAKTTD
ncbi:MAG: DNA repair protein RecN [Thermodesulfobacteriota bacterium]